MTNLFDNGRLLSSASLDSSFYWIPLPIIKNRIFDIKVWLTDEYNKKYITFAQGEIIENLENDEMVKISVWTLKTKKEKWNF